MEKTLKLKEDNIVRVKIVDKDDKPTGEYLEFDFEDIELPLKYEESIRRHNANVNEAKNKLTIIAKQEDVKGDLFLSRKEKETAEIALNFVNKEMEALDLFLGEGGTKKLLNGRKPYYTMFEDITEMLEPLLPELEKSINDVNDKVKTKYKKSEEEENILE